MYAQKDPEIKANWQVSDVLIYKENPEKYVTSMDNPSVVALSCYVWNWKYNITLAQKIKERFPNCKIIIGGPSVDKRNHRFFEDYPWVDVAVTGEGEIAFHRILQAHNAGIDLSYFTDPQLPNTYSRMGRCEGIRLPERIIDLEQIPSPILTGFYDQILEMYKHKVSPNTKWQVTYETLRGCPYKCAFCDIGDNYWNKIQKFNLDRVYAEIDWMSNRKIEYVSVCDSNWGMLERDREITRHVIQQKLETGYPKFWDVTWAKANSKRIYEIAKMEHDAGTELFKGVTFAMQSFNSDTLIATDRFNLDEQEANHYLHKYQQDGISTYSELIWPMPNETYHTLKSGIQQLVDLGQKDFLMVHPLVLTPNATMGQPEYRNKWNLQTAEVPLDTFYLRVIDPDSYIVEYTDAVTSTNTASYTDVIDGFVFSHLFITMFYYGWAYLIMEYLKGSNNIDHVDIIEKMLGYFDDRDSIIGREVVATRESLQLVFEQGAFWGRNGLCSENIYWEYKSASSVVFDQHRDQVRDEISTFLRDCYQIEHPELIRMNDLICYTPDRKYPLKTAIFDENIKSIFAVDTDWIIINHKNYTFETREEFHKMAFHYQRKNRFWKCSVTEDQESRLISQTAEFNEDPQSSQANPGMLNKYLQEEFSEPR